MLPSFSTQQEKLEWGYHCSSASPMAFSRDPLRCRVCLPTSFTHGSGYSTPTTTTLINYGARFSYLCFDKCYCDRAAVRNYVCLSMHTPKPRVSDLLTIHGHGLLRIGISTNDGFLSRHRSSSRKHHTMDLASLPLSILTNTSTPYFPSPNKIVQTTSTRDATTISMPWPIMRSQPENPQISTITITLTPSSTSATKRRSSSNISPL